MKVTLQNAVERNAEYPESFQIPTQEERAGVQPGAFAKCMFTDGKYTERMWIKVVRRNDDGTYAGELNNDPARLALKCGHALTFGPEHIIDLWEPV